MSSSELVGGLIVNCRSYQSLDDIGRAASVINSSGSRFRLAVNPLRPIHEDDTGYRGWQTGAERISPEELREPTAEEWKAEETTDPSLVVERAWRMRNSPEERDNTGLAESVHTPLMYHPPWWPGSRLRLSLELAFYRPESTAVITIGRLLVDPSETLGPAGVDVIEKSIASGKPWPTIVPPRGQALAPLVNQYANDLRDLAAELFPTTGADFGFVGRFPLQLGPKHYYCRPLEVLRISWVNFFGPSLVAKWGKAHLLEAPGLRVVEGPGGSILHQVTANLILAEEPDPLWTDVLTHFRRVTGLDVRVDYMVRPDLFEPTE
jgi:hypothetical protein